MHATRSCWAGQVFATASSNESGSKKSRIRKSKEERKSMVESFIIKYQNSNNGNFPSLNLTHKEVGGSFYTVREIVREIIQENRVLAPPKLSLEENGHSGFLEQHPLGSISIQPQIDLSASDKIHMATHSMPSNHQIITSEKEYNSRSSVQYNGSYTIELNNEEVSKEKTNEEDVSNCIDQLPQPKSHEFEDAEIVNGFEVIQENPHSDKPLVTNVGHQGNRDNSLLSSEKSDGSESERCIDEQSHMISNVVVVETFPLRPVLRTVHNMDNAVQRDKSISVQSSSALVDEKDEEKLLEPTVESDREYNEEILKIANDQLASKVSVLDIADSADLESNVTKARSSKASSDRDNSSLPKGNNPMLDRINLETWEVTSKKSTRPESNPILALVKAFITSFVKFWTE